MNKRYTPSDLPLVAQVSILLAALDQIAVWSDGDSPDDRSAFAARKALAAAGFTPLPPALHTMADAFRRALDKAAPAGVGKTARL